MADDPIHELIPTLERARQAHASLTTRVWWRRGSIDLLEREPSATRKLAAVVVVAHAGNAPPGSQALLRYAYVPSMPFPLEEGLAQLWERTGADMPDPLRVDIERDAVGDPYRGTRGAPPRFRDHDYGDALRQARTALGSLRQQHASNVSIHTFAWPILWLTFGGLAMKREVAIVVRPDRVMHAVVCKGRLFG